MDIENILAATVESEEMRAYLSDSDACALRKIICGAPVSLHRKLNLLNGLLDECAGNDHADCLLSIRALEAALAALSMKLGELFQLRCCWFDLDDENRVHHADLKLCACMEEVTQAILCDIAFENEDEPPEEHGGASASWYETEKWTLRADENVGARYEQSGWIFTLLGTEVCYFKYGKRNRGEHRFYEEFEGSSDLNLPVPFRAGDIVTVDCRPFTPLQHALILAVNDNRDCCCLRAAFVDGRGRLCADSVKHSHCFTDRYTSRLSPLYRMTRYAGKLQEQERILGGIRDEMLRLDGAGRESYGRGFESALRSME